MIGTRRTCFRHTYTYIDFTIVCLLIYVRCDSLCLKEMQHDNVSLPFPSKKTSNLISSSEPEHPSTTGWFPVDGNGTIGHNNYSVEEAETYELLGDGNLAQSTKGYGPRPAYKERSTIDWLLEESAERERTRALQSGRGLRGTLAPTLESARWWFVFVLTGAGIGIAGAWLDVLVKWCVVES